MKKILLILLLVPAFIFAQQSLPSVEIKSLDNSNFKKIFPDFIFTDIRAGIKESAEYYLKII